MSVEVTECDGYVLTVHNRGAYMDFGLSINHPQANGELYYSPHALCGEVYGYSPPDGMDWDTWQADHSETPGVEWTDKEWRECLLAESNEFIEAFVDHDALAALDETRANGDPRGDDDPAGWCTDCNADTLGCKDWEDHG